MNFGHGHGELNLLLLQGLDLFAHGGDVLGQALDGCCELVDLCGLLLALDLVVMEQGCN